MIWLLCFMVAGMAWRFVEAITMGRWSAVWYGAEILTFALFIGNLMI
jgi:hypothetical protein